VLTAEKETLGLYLSGNPLSAYEGDLARHATHTSADVKEGFEGEVTMGGLVTQIRKTKIKMGPNAGRVMGRFVLEDLHGGIPVTLFANQMQQFNHLITEEAVVLIKGEVRERGSDVELSAMDITPLSLGSGKIVSGVDLVVPANFPPTEMLRLRDLLIENPGAIPVTFEVRDGEKTHRIRSRDAYSVELGRELVASIENLLGAGTVKERLVPLPS
jgi:DNA polymerase-3 subunit alpha